MIIYYHYAAKLISCEGSVIKVFFVTEIGLLSPKMSMTETPFYSGDQSVYT